ncbi:MAG: outer membrane protein assembly factor BamD [Candidatus Aminicenantes bacterium]|nr:outer membrane protein assembly factor BamD [Candidatus Aminicenantes bacterium]
MTTHRKIFMIFIIALFCGAGVWSCKEKPVEIAPEIAGSDEALFKAGQEFMEKDAEKARLYFRQVIDSFPKSFYAQRAKLAIADTYSRKSDESSLILAAAEYREFIQLYPYSPSASYAQYQIAMTFFKKILKPGRDQTKTSQALAEFKKVLTQYPLSEEAKLAQEKTAECEERLAEHNFSIGYHYYRRRAYKASTDRLTEILTSFPSFSKMDEVYFYLADSYYKWNKIEESTPYFTKLVTDYPESDFAEKAQDRLAEIDRTRPQTGS